jgi:ribonuclease D
MPDPPDVTFVDEPALVRSELDRLTGSVVGVDVERADADRYFRRAALVQVGVPGSCVLIDTVALPSLPELERYLDADRLTVLHAIENDLEPLASLGVRPSQVADTAVAAAVLGLPTGLGPLLAEVLDIELDGDKSAYQRANWEERPLSAGMAAYAAGDVVHLPELWAALQDRLATADRTAWYAQELEWTVQRASEDNRDWTKVKGIGRMSPEQRAVLHVLWDARERLAREHDVAPNRLLHDDVLRDLATDPPRTEAQLVRRSQRRRSLLRRHAGELLAAVVRGQQAPPEVRAGSGRRWSEHERSAFDAMRKARTGVAEELAVDPGVLCPSRTLWDAIAAAPEDPDGLCDAAGLRPWQRELLSEPLWEAYTSSLSPGERHGEIS